MRKIVLLIGTFLLFGFTENNSNPFTVSGTLKNSPSKVVYIEETIIATGQTILKDSARINADGKFSISIDVPGEGVYNLRLSNEPAFATIINDAEKINIEADFKKQFDFYNVSGSAASKGIKDYLAKLNELQREKFNYYNQADSIRKNKGDSLVAASLEQKQRDITQQMKTITEQTVKQSTKAPFSLFILATYQGMANNQGFRMFAFTAEELVGLLTEMINKFPGNDDIVNIKNSIEAQIKRSLVGKQAPEISLPDTEGKEVKLSSYRGKYVLVDFWASWCGPCRRENPTVVEAYNRFRDKNFTVLGVSLDKQKEAWQKAIVDDNLNWTHISDLKYWSSAVVPLYGIQSIPFNVLVDPDGKIVAENLRGSALEQKLGEILGGYIPPKKSSGSSSSTLLIVAGVTVIVLLLGWFLFFRKKEPKKIASNKNQGKKKPNKR
jgi:LPXTG-motif cell wall-anchored protein